MSIRLVRQIDVDGCGVACLAMVTGESYEYMLYRVALRKVKQGKTNFGMWLYEVEDMLRRMGLRYERRRFRGWTRIESHAILFVHPGHCVVFVKGRGRDYILDPWPASRGRRYDFHGVQAKGFYIALVQRRRQTDERVNQTIRCADHPASLRVGI